MNIGMMLGSALGGILIQHTNIINLTWIGGLFVILAFIFINYSFNLNKAKLRKVRI